VLATLVITVGRECWFGGPYERVHIANQPPQQRILSLDRNDGLSRLVSAKLGHRLTGPNQRHHPRCSGCPRPEHPHGCWTNLGNWSADTDHTAATRGEVTPTADGLYGSADQSPVEATAAIKHKPVDSFNQRPSTSSPTTSRALLSLSTAGQPRLRTRTTSTATMLFTG